MNKLYGNYTQNTKATHTVSFVYAHGMLESLLQHDILCAERHTQFNPGVHAVTVVDNDGFDRKCILFAWEFGPMRKGLVVLESDYEGAKDAAQKFAEQRVMV